MKHHELLVTLGNATIIFTIDDKAASPSISHQHTHTNFEFFFVWNGSVRLETDDKEFIVNDGQAILVPPSIYHQTFTEHNTKKFNMYFSFKRISKNAGNEDIYKELYQTFSTSSLLKIENAKKIENYLLEIQEILNTNCLGKSERIRALLTGLIFSLYDSLITNHHSPYHFTKDMNIGMQYRYKIDSLLSQNFSEKITLNDISERLYLSSKHTAFIIKSLYGKGFRKVRTEMKLQVAKQLLKETNLTVSEIAKKVGYDSTRGFLYAFTQMYNITPAQYKKLKNNN